jgi:hypothetical protein
MSKVLFFQGLAMYSIHSMAPDTDNCVITLRGTELFRLQVRCQSIQYKGDWRPLTVRGLAQTRLITDSTIFQLIITVLLWLSYSYCVQSGPKRGPSNGPRKGKLGIEIQMLASHSFLYMCFSSIISALVAQWNGTCFRLFDVILFQNTFPFSSETE